LLTHEQRIRTYISAISGKVGLSTLEEIKQIIRQYTLGLFFLMLIVFVLYVIGLLIAGVPYAVLIAAISAFATIVPTVGTFLGGMFAVIVS
jgi:predicted PurR-regulated permease PerM